MKTTASNTGKDFMIFCAISIASITTIFALIQNVKHVFISASQEINVYCFFEML